MTRLVPKHLIDTIIFVVVTVLILQSSAAHDCETTCEESGLLLKSDRVCGFNNVIYQNECFARCQVSSKT